MAEQAYRSIYFPDAPGNSSKEKNITVAFGKNETGLHAFARTLSSEQLRQVLGHQTYTSLRAASEKQGVKVSSYVKAQLRSVALLEQDRAEYAQTQLSLAGILDPALATFRGGTDQPLHNWFPYL